MKKDYGNNYGEEACVKSQDIILKTQKIVRYNNKGRSPKPTSDMLLSMGKSNCKSDYGCCGNIIAGC